jgi:hypothetical protein
MIVYIWSFSIANCLFTRGYFPDYLGTSWNILYQWEFQDPKMEVLYHIRPYFVVIFTYIGLKNRPYIW